MYVFSQSHKLLRKIILSSPIHQLDSLPLSYMGLVGSRLLACDIQSLNISNQCLPDLRKKNCDYNNNNYIHSGMDPGNSETEALQGHCPGNCKNLGSLRYYFLI